MTKESVEIAKFILGVSALKEPNGTVVYRIESANGGVPHEVVLAQVRAFLHYVDEEYFDEFDKSISRYDPEA